MIRCPLVLYYTSHIRCGGEHPTTLPASALPEPLPMYTLPHPHTPGGSLSHPGPVAVPRVRQASIRYAAPQMDRRRDMLREGCFNLLLPCAEAGLMTFPC